MGANVKENSSAAHLARKRVARACFRCQVKKTKCDGDVPCKRCIGNDEICFPGPQRRHIRKTSSFPPGYAEALERQQEWLVKGIQKLYLLARNGQPAHLGFRNDREVPTHELLSHLGVLNPEKGDRFEESPRAVEQDLAQHYSDCTSEQDHDERSPSTPSSDFDTCPPDPTDSTQSLPVASWENPTTSEIPLNMGLLVGEHLNKGISPSQFSAYLHAGDCEQTEDQRLPGTQEIFTPFAKYQMGLRVIESTGLWNDQGNLGPSPVWMCINSPRV